MTAANANSNSRADRSNVVFLNTMAENVPADAAGYGAEGADLSYAERLAKTEAAYGAFAPCAAEAGGADDACVALLRRLAHLNQQSDGGALALRAGAACLTEAELDAINNKNERENHPRNCAKLNGKPFPYFDGGMMMMKKAGTFSFFSSRNNNFSNRDQTGVICVKNADGSGCELAAKTGVLQDANPSITVAPLAENPVLRQARARCFEEASAVGVATAQGAASCQSLDGELIILEDGTFAVDNADNDALGDGNKDPCDVLVWSVFGKHSTKVKRYFALAFSLLAAGIVTTYAAYFSYNRYRAHILKTRKFKEGGDWKYKKQTEMM